MKAILIQVLTLMITFASYSNSMELDSVPAIEERGNEPACLVQARDRKNNHIQTFVTDFNGLAGVIDAGAKCLAFMSKRKDPLCYCRIHQTICSPMSIPATWAEIMKEALGFGVSALYEKYALQKCHKKSSVLVDDLTN